MQEAIDKVEQWAYVWGVRLSVEKTQTVFFSRRRIEVNTKLRLYGRRLERVQVFRFLGGHLLPINMV